MRIFSEKRGIISEQLFMIFSLIVVVIFTIVAVRYTNGLATDLLFKQDYYAHDISFLIATSIGAPGIVIYDYSISEDAKFTIDSAFVNIALKDEETQQRALQYLSPSKYYHINKADFEFKTAEDLTKLQLMNYDEEFVATQPVYYTDEELDCMQYLNYDSKSDINSKKIVIDPGRGGSDGGIKEEDNKDQNLQKGKNLFAALGGQLAAGPSVVMTRDRDVSVSQEERNNIVGDMFISIHGLHKKKNEEIVIGKPTRENKKLACLLSKELGIEQVRQASDNYIENNPSSITVALYLGPGKHANAIANSVRSYYV
ncbi:hypothetical protein GF371_00425 [Candidatus Woesearchaeota archaeon]|nr:hypothetical protein [Candidatus Woesearchaeota archaeon]